MPDGDMPPVDLPEDGEEEQPDITYEDDDKDYSKDFESEEEQEQEL